MWFKKRQVKEKPEEQGFVNQAVNKASLIAVEKWVCDRDEWPVSSYSVTTDGGAKISVSRMGRIDIDEGIYTMFIDGENIGDYKCRLVRYYNSEHMAGCKGIMDLYLKIDKYQKEKKKEEEQAYAASPAAKQAEVLKLQKEEEKKQKQKDILRRL